MKNADAVVRVVFAALASLVSASLGYGYHWIQYHNAVEHHQCELNGATAAVTALAPWVFVLPAVVLVVGLIWRRKSLVMLVAANTAWLFAVTWPPLCLWAWETLNIIM